eukprot:5224961-Alexandrium_andersonii.AAC.1
MATNVGAPRPESGETGDWTKRIGAPPRCLTPASDVKLSSKGCSPARAVTSRSRIRRGVGGIEGGASRPKCRVATGDAQLAAFAGPELRTLLTQLTT